MKTYETCPAWPQGAAKCPQPCPSGASDICIRFAEAHKEYAPKTLKPICPTCGRPLGARRR